jgi:hypothetical protein
MPFEACGALGNGKAQGVEAGRHLEGTRDPDQLRRSPVAVQGHLYQDDRQGG